MVDPHSIDLVWWVDVVIKAGAMSAALYGLYRVWLRPVVAWFQHQGEMNIQIASVVAEQLPKMTKAIEAVSAIQVTHDRDINDLRGRVQRLEGAAAGEPAEIPLVPYYGDVQERLRRFSRIPGPLEPDLPFEERP